MLFYNLQKKLYTRSICLKPIYSTFFHIGVEKICEHLKCINWLQIISGSLIIVLFKIRNKDIFKNGRTIVTCMFFLTRAFTKQIMCFVLAEIEQNPRVVLVERHLKDKFQPLAMGQRDIPLDQVAQDPIQPVLQQVQGWNVHHFSGKCVPVPQHPHNKEFLPYI